MWAGLPVTHGIKPNTVPIRGSPWSPDQDLNPKQVTRNSPGPSGLETTEGPLSAMNPIRNSNPRSERFKYTEVGTGRAKVGRRQHSPQGVTDGSRQTAAAGVPPTTGLLPMPWPTQGHLLPHLPQDSWKGHAGGGVHCLSLSSWTEDSTGNRDTNKNKGAQQSFLGRKHPHSLAHRLPPRCPLCG